MPDETSQPALDPGQASSFSRDVSDSPALADVVAVMIRNPWDLLLKRWNWKSALLSTVIRGAIFFSVNLLGGVASALSALATEFLFRPLVAGFDGAVIELFRSARPPWGATLVVVLALPAVNHLIEIAVHWTRGTQRLGASVLASLSFSALSGLFNLFAMRRGLLIVGDGRRSILEDLRRLPLVVGAFLMAAPRFVLKIHYWRRLG